MAIFHAQKIAEQFKNQPPNNSKYRANLLYFAALAAPPPSAKPSFFKIAIDLRLRALLRQG